MGSPKLKTENENVLGLRPLCLEGRGTWTGYRTWMQGPKVTSSSASSSTLPNTEESPLLPPSPETQHREEEDTTGRANGRQGSYSLLMGSRVGVGIWD